MTLFLYGGWGHDNFGDDLILKAYLEYYSRSDNVRPIKVVSRRPKETRARLQTSGLANIAEVVSIQSALAMAGTQAVQLVVCGGGYVNGIWRREATRKLFEIALLADRAKSSQWHAVQVSNLKHPWQRSLLRYAARKALAFSVRDKSSQAIVEALGVQVRTVPDSLALSTRPHSHLRSNYTLINLTDISRRGDSSEANFSEYEWNKFLQDLKEYAKTNSVRLIAAARYERDWLRTHFQGDVVYPTTSVEFEKLIENASMVIATRMHVALCSLRAGIPTASIAYNSKVLPTLAEAGLAEHVVERFSTEAVFDRLRVEPERSAWRNANDRCRAALE